MKKIAVTGTKGKTTIVRMLDYILLNLNKKTLSVDTETVKLNGKQIYDVKYSKKVSGMIPSKCPGRFLHLGLDRNNEWNIDYSIFETSIGCFDSGLGYHSHDIGLFTNIYEDHIGPTARKGVFIKDKRDIAKRKRYFISQISSDGVVICNYDDEEIRNITKDTEKLLLYVTNQEKNYQNNSKIIALLNKEEIKIKVGKEEVVYSLKNNTFSFYGKFLPSVYNISFVLTGLLKLLGEEQFLENFDGIKKLLDAYTPDVYGGRMCLISYNDRNIILDYAHEKQSLKAILNLASDLSTNKTIAVVRLAPDRKNDLYRETGEYISQLSDTFIVYDKIDGIERKSYTSLTGAFTREPGEVMKLFGNAIKEKNRNTYQIIYWKDAIKKALEISNKGDTIVIIVNDPKKTGEFILELLKN